MILCVELCLKGLPRHRKLSLNETIKPIIAHCVLLIGIQTPARHGPCPSRASVFNYGMKEVSRDIREVMERRTAPSLSGKFIYLPLTHCASTNMCLPNQWTLGSPQRRATDTKACECPQSHVQLMLTRLSDNEPQFTMDLLTLREVILDSTGSAVIQDF